jgi:DNA-binding MarR family transcriptional regulator
MQSDGQILGAPVANDAIAEIGSTCLLMRTRLISRVIAGIYEEQLRPFGIGAAYFVLLVAIYQRQPATRAEIGRFQHQVRSVLTRNLKVIMSEGWVEEKLGLGDGRRRPLMLTKAGIDLLRSSEPVWRAAQAQAKALLGSDGVTVVNLVADRIIGTDIVDVVAPARSGANPLFRPTR